MSNDTQTRILETAWTLVNERGIGVGRSGEIAAAAGVSRQLVYVHFTSRAGLLVAMARHQDARSGFRERALATRELPPAHGTRSARARLAASTCPRSCRSRSALEAALITGEDGAVAWRDRMGELHEAFRPPSRGSPKPASWRPAGRPNGPPTGPGPRCQPSNWLHLVVERGWSAEEYVVRTRRRSINETCLANV